MTITLQLKPEEQAKLIAVAQAKGQSADELVREVIGRIIAGSAEAITPKEPTLSLRGLLAKYGAAPSAEEIDRNREEMFANFPRSDFL